MTRHTCKALDVPQLVDGLIEVVPSLDGKLTASTLLGKQGRKVLGAVGVTILHVEGTRAQLALAMVTHEALGVETLLQGVNALAHDDTLALTAAWCKELLKVLLAEQAAIFFDKTGMLQIDATVGMCAHKVIRTEDFSDGADEGTAYDHVARVACGHVACDGRVKYVAAQGAAVGADKVL